jgi:hemoglobin-like flavoprotein
MMLTVRQRNLVQGSFLLLGSLDDVTALFYTRLFQLDPSLKSMFTGDLGAQRRKLGHMLTTAVKGLDHPDRLIPVLRELGRRHVGYGVTDHQFNIVGAALLLTLEDGLGPVFTAEVAAAWTEVYAFLAETMKEGMRESGILVYKETPWASHMAVGHGDIS